MSDIMSFSPLWGEWEIVSKIGEGSFGTVWKVRRNVVSGKVYYAAVKHISIPKDESEIDRLIGEGIFSDERSAVHYYSHMLQSIADEIDAMHQLRGYTNIVAYEDHKIIPQANGIGYDLLLRMELLEPLTVRIRRGMKVRDVVDVGKDIATAISVLCDHHMIHRDIKPQNIFVNDRGIYKLGDYGTARALGTSATAMSRKGTFNYMSPEIYNNQKADIRADIYSLGLVMYRLLNGNRLPFLPIDESITSEDSDRAVLYRISGEEIKPPRYADKELSDIVLKACAFDPENRYLHPEEMVRDLEMYIKNHDEPVEEDDQDKTVDDSQEPQYSSVHSSVQDRKSIRSGTVDRKGSERSARQQEPSAKGSGQYQQPRHSRNQSSGNSTGKKKKWLIPLIALLSAALACGVLFGAGILPPGNPPEPSETPTAIISDIPDFSPESGSLLPKTESPEVAATYTITWQDDSGNMIGTAVLESGTVPVPPEPVKDPDPQFSYSFAGWEPEIKAVTEDAVYTAAFTKETRSYTIIWQDDAGNTIDTTDAEYGTMPVHADPVKASDPQYNYSFAGWQPEIRNVSGDTIYKAAFNGEIRSYTIAWQDDTGKTIDTTTVEYGREPTHTDLTKESDEQYNYTFTGWEPKLATVSGDAAYKASFSREARRYTITWLDDTGKTIDTTTAKAGTLPFHARPVKKSDQQYSYTFIGWEPEITAVSGNTTYKASFSRKTRHYTITWLDDTGKTIDTTIAEYGIMPAHADPVKESDQQYSYTFIGWSPQIAAVSGDASYTAEFRQDINAVQDVAIDAEHFPDAGFRNYVQKFDKDKDLTLSSSELEKVTSIDVKQRGLTSLNGIEYFTSLNSLECSSNRLTKLDLSSNIVLKTLQCYSNQLMELDVSRCAKLDFLNCSDNKLTKLDVIMNTGLRCLNFTRNQLTEIDLSKNTGLIELWCESNRLTKLDVGNNNRLEIIDCYDNRLTELDVSTNVNLKRFSCNSNQLTELDVSKNTVLRELRCSSNKLTELDISKCPELIRLVEKYTPGQNSSGYGWWNDNTNCLLVDQSVNVITEAAISPGSPWDCPECGRIGNSGNYCGGCAHPAPWIEQETNTTAIVDSGTWENIKWKFDEEGVLTVIGKGAIAGNPDQATTWMQFRQKIKSVIIDDGITAIGTGSFINCIFIKEVALPQSLSEIGKNAFSGCSRIKSITIPSGVKKIGNAAFKDCTALNEVRLSEGISAIGDSAFENCKKLSSILIPISVQDIGDSAFKCCESLEKIEIPSGVKTIKYSTFSYCKKLKGINIPDGVKTIQDYAFSYCEQLEEMSIPGSVQQFGQIMDHCYALKTISVDDSSKAYTSVDGVLYTKNKDTIVKYPAQKAEETYSIAKGVKVIYDNAFENCTQLKSITIPEGVTSIGSLAFCGCSNLSSINLPASVKKLGYMAFSQCNTLKSVEIPGSVTSMDYYVFAYCPNLTSATINDGVTTVGGYAFRDCVSLKSITLPKSVIKIGTEAFMGCGKLKDVYYDGARDGISIEIGNIYLEKATWH